jgi:hypothetical protein
MGRGNFLVIRDWGLGIRYYLYGLGFSISSVYTEVGDFQKINYPVDGDGIFLYSPSQCHLSPLP